MDAPTQEATITITLDSATLTRLQGIASATEQDLQSIIAEAIGAYLEWDEEFRADVEEGLRQADAGEFATEEEVKAVYARWQ